jgi:hypothetical protein
MNAALIKVDVVSVLLGWPTKKLYSLVDESAVRERGFAWVFNLARDPQGGRKDLRWWWPEIQARLSPDSKENKRYSFYQLPWVINRIVPDARLQYTAGEVDRLLQIRPHSRLNLHAELLGATDAGSDPIPVSTFLEANCYPRAALARFLERRWIQNLKQSAEQPNILSTTENYAHAH